MSSFSFNLFEFVLTFILYLKYLVSGEAQLGGQGRSHLAAILTPKVF